MMWNVARRESVANSRCLWKVPFVRKRGIATPPGWLGALLLHEYVYNLVSIL